MILPAVIQVRFSDLDVLGHVNNSVYLSYFEIARVHYFSQLLGRDWNWQRQGVILVKNEVEYILPVLLHHEPEITIRAEHIGTKSFTLSYKVNVDGKLHAKGNSILVAYNSTLGTTIEIPEEMKGVLQKIAR